MATYIETALVSSAGKLLIQLDDGTVIDAGYVRGGQGPAGRDGQDGAPGIPGAKGDPGENGAKWHTGVGAPEIVLGDAGDLYMDVANALLPIYQKVGRDWIFLANLKVPPSGGGGGQGGAAGGGGSIILYPMPDGGTPPTNDNDGKPVDKGDIWLDTNSGWLWVYDGNVWLPVGDRPPVSISPTPPLWNPAGDINNRYPIVDGDLWFDSDQLALYVAARDEDDDLRWVITTPADRSVLQDEVDIPDNPFTFPSPKAGGGSPFDGMTVYNPVTKLWYVFNASKNQWIDLPPGVNELSLQAILVRGADGFDETFEYEQADRDRLGTDALCYVNADNHDAFTRIVIPDLDTADFDWSFILRALQAGDQLTLIQKDESDPDDIFPFRSDYLTVGEVTENSESFNTEISFESEQPIHAPLFDEPVLIRFKAIVNVGEGEIYYQETAPDPNTEPELTAGNIWIDSDDNKMYVWNGQAWSEVTACAGISEGDYVRKEGGDSMEGPLTIEGPRKAGDDPTKPYLVSSIKTLNIDNAQNSGLHLRHSGSSKVYIGSDDVAFASNIKFNRAQPTIIKNNTQDLISVGTNEIQYLGISVEDNDIITKKYVDDIAIELEEEINAIAPTVQRGTWAYNASAIVANTAPGDGNFYLQEDGSTVVTDYPSANRVFLSKKNSVGDDVTFANVVVDQLIGLFDADDNDYLIGTITAVDATNAAYVQIDFTFEQGEGAPEDTKLARLNIFEAPTGGSGSEFLPLAGGNMTGAINLNPTPYNGISVFGKDGPAYNNGTKLVFRAENGGSYTDPLVIIGVEPTADNHATTKKYVDDKFDFSQYAELS